TSTVSTSGAPTIRTSHSQHESLASSFARRHPPSDQKGRRDRARQSPYVNMPPYLVSMRAWNAARAQALSDGTALPQAHELLRRYRQSGQIQGATDWRSVLITATGADPDAR
ncbi:MAG: hypothetical protein ACRDQZ_09530, partial [Mycobacteriales bacterium]